MDERRAVNRTRRPWDALWLVAFGTLLFGWRLGSHDLWPTDEPRFGEVAREMWEAGDHVVLSLNGRLYTEKPPLFFWAVNGFAHLTGSVDETAARLPSVVGGVLALLLILRLGEVLYDRPTGRLAAILFATSVQILERARWASIDMTLNLFVLAAILLLWEATSGGGGRWRVPLAWVAMGCATLAKGPVGLVLPLLVLVPATILTSGWRSLGRLAPPAGILLYLAVALAWFVPFALRIGPGEAIGVLTHQTVERYVDAWNAQHPIWYYLWRFPAGFFPWIVFLPWALLSGLARSRTAEERRPALVLACWIAAIFVFFSLSTGKRGVYIIPLYPAAALLVARLFRETGGSGADRAEPPRSVRASFSVWAAVAAVTAAAVVTAVPSRHPELRSAAIGAAIALVVPAALSLWLALRGRPVQAALTVAASMAGILLVCTELVVPWANGHLNLSGFARQVRGHLRDEIPLAATEEKRDAWVYYTRRLVEEVDSREQVLAYLGGPPPRDLLIEEEFLERIRGDLPAGVRPVVSGQVSGRPYHLLRSETAR